VNKIKKREPCERFISEGELKSLLRLSAYVAAIVDHAGNQKDDSYAQYQQNQLMVNQGR
jgi:hypothetical protein